MNFQKIINYFQSRNISEDRPDSLLKFHIISQRVKTALNYITKQLTAPPKTATFRKQINNHTAKQIFTLKKINRRIATYNYNPTI